MSETRVTSSDVDELVGIMREAASAYINGEMTRYFDLMNHADDFTLMDPFGGETTHGDVVTPERIAALAALFRGGECALEVVQTYASGNLAVLVAVEHQHGVVGNYPAQDWSLRATLVFRLVEAGWQLVHRHADPLVHPIDFDRLAELAAWLMACDGAHRRPAVTDAWIEKVAMRPVRPARTEAAARAPGRARSGCTGR